MDELKIILKEARSHKKRTYCMIPFILNSGKWELIYNGTTQISGRLGGKGAGVRITKA